MTNPIPPDKTGLYRPTEVPDSDGTDGASEVDSGTPLSAGASVLKALGASVPALPRVQLRDPDSETMAPVVRPSSTEMPDDSHVRSPDGRIRLDGEIARGGMGAILKGRDTDLGRDIAVKVLLETHQGKTEFVQRFVEEAQISGQLQHPGVAPVYELGRFADKRPYFTMKLVKGKTLAALFAGRKNPSDDRSRFIGIFAQVCNTLAYAHARGVIHRDLKPSNVMVGAFGEVQVMDWGLAKVLTEGGVADEKKAQQRQDVSVIRTQRSTGSEAPEFGSFTQVGSVLGTPAYMAPEQSRGDVDLVDERADVFGLGAILCELLTGKPPFTGKGAEATRKSQMAKLDDAWAGLDACGADAELVGLAKRCLAAEPWDRPRNAGAVAAAVTTYQNSVVERLHKAEVERAAEQVRAEDEIQRRQLADQLATEAHGRAVEERRRRRVTVALAGSVVALVLLGGGATLSYVQDRQARQARLDLALHEAQLLRDQAAVAPEGAVAKWQQARLAVEKANGVVGTAAAASALDRLAELQSAVDKGLAEAEADERLVARLDQIRSGMEGKQADAAYAEAFRAAGLDLSTPAAMNERLKTRPPIVRQSAIEALDAWSVVSGEEAGDAGLKRVLEAARIIDPDDRWRNRLRDALEHKELDGFRRLAVENETQAEQGPISLWLLGHSLEKLGDHELALTVLKQGQQRFPGDYWLNLELGMAMLGGKRTGSGSDASALLLNVVNEKYRAAEPYLTAAVALRPHFAPAYVPLAMAFGLQGKWEAALATTQTAIALDPNYSMAHNDHGLYLFKQGKFDEAIPKFRLALKLDPKNQDAHQNIGVALRQQGNPAEAIPFYRAALALDPKLVPARQSLSVALRDLGQLEEAVQVQRDFVAIDPKNAQAQNLLGDALAAQGKREEAITAWKKAITLDPQHFWAHANLGRALREQGKLPEAIAACREAIAIEPTIAELHSRLGDVLRAQGKTSEAIAAYRQAISLNPKHYWAVQNLSGLLFAAGKADEAITVVRQSAALNPNRYAGHLNLAYALRNHGRLDEAVAEFRQALLLQPKTGGAYRGLSSSLRDQGKLAEAAATDRIAVMADPKDVWSQKSLGDNLREQGKMQEAVAVYRQAVALDPNIPLVHWGLGFALVNLGKPDEAIAAFRQAITLEPGNSGFHTGLGWALRARGTLDESAAAYRKAVALDPPNIVAIQGLARTLRMTAVQDKFSAFLRGEFQPTNSNERLGLAELCRIKKLYFSALRLYADAFASDSKLAEDLRARHRYEAAYCAAQAAAGQGEEAAKIDDKEKAHWRKQALDWLRADLAKHSEQLANDKTTNRNQLIGTLGFWQQDSSLLSLRDPDAINKLPADEQEACKKFWAEVAALRQKAREKAK